MIKLPDEFKQPYRKIDEDCGGFNAAEMNYFLDSWNQTPNKKIINKEESAQLLPHLEPVSWYLVTATINTKAYHLISQAFSYSDCPVFVVDSQWSKQLAEFHPKYCKFIDNPKKSKISLENNKIVPFDFDYSINGGILDIHNIFSIEGEAIYYAKLIFEYILEDDLDLVVFYKYDKHNPSTGCINNKSYYTKKSNYSQILKITKNEQN